MAALLCRMPFYTALLSRRGFCFLLGGHLITPLCPYRRPKGLRPQAA